MPDAIIENPILNSPFEEPTRHFKFTDDGITNDIVESRRLSGYFVPIPQPKKKGKQLVFDSEWTQDRSAGLARHHEHIHETAAALVGPRA